MGNDPPDPVLFKNAPSSLITAAAKAAKGEPPRVAVCGECTAALWVQAKTDAAIRLEYFRDGIAKRYDVDVYAGMC
jgi:hypothetical protein